MASADQIPGQGKLIGIGVLLVILFFVGTSCFRTVETGTIGVVTYFGKVEPETLDEGIHLLNPLKKVTLMNLRTLNLSEVTSCFSKDLQVLKVEYTALVRLPKVKASQVYQTVGLDYGTRVVVPRVQEVIKQQTARYNAEEVVAQRNEIRNAIIEQLKERLTTVVEVEDFALRNIDFSEEYEQAIEAKQVAQQEALRATYELQRAEVEAKTRVAQAEGEAKAIQVRGEALAKNPAVVQLEAIQKWNGVSPQTVMLQGDAANSLPVVFPVK